jgi:hypothetical protein
VVLLVLVLLLVLLLLLPITGTGRVQGQGFLGVVLRQVVLENALVLGVVTVVLCAPA